MIEAEMIRVLLVEDSPSQRAIAAWAISRSPGFDLVGQAVNGAEAIEKVEALRPGIVLMDCHMPVMTGTEATRAIMHRCPVPIIVTSASFEQDDLHPGLDALREGALAIVPKLPDPASDGFDRAVADLLLSLKLMSEVHVMRRTASGPRSAPASLPGAAIARVIALGASTGGPPALLEILKGLGPGLPVPVLIVQHIAAGFTPGFVDWLARGSGLPVTIACADSLAKPGHVYVGPEGRHLGIDRRGTLTLTDGPAEHGFRPSVSCLFRSVGDAFGTAAVAVLLTGMGEDGALGLAHVLSRGGTTVIQDRDSSVVFGMPGAALKIGAAQRVLPLAEIAGFLRAQISGRTASS